MRHPYQRTLGLSLLFLVSLSCLYYFCYLHFSFFTPSFLLQCTRNKMEFFLSCFYYSIFIVLPLGFEVSISLILSSKIPFVKDAFADVSPNSTSIGMSAWYFLSPFSACMITY